MSVPRELTEWLRDYEARVVGQKGNQYSVVMTDPSRWPFRGNMDYITTETPCISVVLRNWLGIPKAKHGIDHAKTVSGKGSCQPKYQGKPFTCLCGIGPMTLPELYGHMTGDSVQVGSEQWTDAADVGVLEHAGALPEQAVREAAERLDRRSGRRRAA